MKRWCHGSLVTAEFVGGRTSRSVEDTQASSPVASIGFWHWRAHPPAPSSPVHSLVPSFSVFQSPIPQPPQRVQVELGRKRILVHFSSKFPHLQRLSRSPNHHLIFGGDKIIGVPISPNFGWARVPLSCWIAIHGSVQFSSVQFRDF